MAQIKFAIFDIGQVIYPYTLEYVNNVMKVLSTDKNLFDNGHSAFDYDYNPYMKGIQPFEDFVKNLCRFCAVPYNSELLKSVGDALRRGRGGAYSETLEAMRKLQENGVELGILSNALPVLDDENIRFAKRENVFVSYKLGLLKPDTKIYQTMAQKLDTPYEEILFIDDKSRNILPAQALGIKGIIFKPETILQDIEPYLK